MASMFVEQMKKKGKDRLSQINSEQKIEEMEAMASYMSLLQWNNALIALFVVILGALALMSMGYFVQLEWKNESFYTSSFLELMFFGACSGIALWGIKSFAAYVFWRGVIRKDEAESSISTFLNIEGMSDIVFVISLPFFFVIWLATSIYFACLVIGGALFFKYVLMYLSYPHLLKNIQKIDRLILIGSSIASLFLLKLFFDLFIWR